MGKLIAIDPDIKEQIRQGYLHHESLNDLSSKFKVSTATISKWRENEGWAELRKRATEGLLDDLTEGRKIRVSKLAGDILDQLDRGLIHLKNREEPLTVAEMDKMTLVFANLHKIGRLDSNQSTENLSMKVDVNAQLTVDKIRDIITSDAFTAPAARPVTDDAAE